MGSGYGVRPDRGSSLAAEGRRRQDKDKGGRARCRPASRRLALVTAMSVSRGAIMSAVAASARCSAAGRRSGRSGPGADDHVTVTDSHHPALRMAPGPSSRQCPRDSRTCCRRSPWPSGIRWRS